MNSGEREERLKQVRERQTRCARPDRDDVPQRSADPLARELARELRQAQIDRGFLLSLLDSQAQTARELALIVDVGTSDDPGTAIRKICKLESDAATRMRDLCVAKVRAMGLRCGLCPHGNPPNADGSCSAYGYNGVDCQAQPCVCRRHDPTVQYYGKLITALSSLTLDQVEKKQ